MTLDSNHIAAGSIRTDGLLNNPDLKNRRDMLDLYVVVWSVREEEEES